MGRSNELSPIKTHYERIQRVPELPASPLGAPIKFHKQRGLHPIAKAREMFREGITVKNVAALSAVAALAVGAVNKEDVANVAMDCPAGVEWSGLSMPSCAEGLPDPLPSAAEFPVPGSNGETLKGLADYQITNVTAVDANQVAVIAELKPDMDLMPQLFEGTPEQIQALNVFDFAANIKTVVSPQACATDMNSVIALAQRAVHNLTSVEATATALTGGESVYTLEGHGPAANTGAADRENVPNIAVYIDTGNVLENGNHEIAPVACV